MERLQPSLWVPGPWSPTAPFQKSRTHLISGAEAIQMIEAIERRPDIWIHPDLCRRVVKTLQE